MTSLMNQTKRKMWKAIDKMFDQTDRDRNSVTHRREGLQTDRGHASLAHQSLLSSSKMAKFKK